MSELEELQPEFNNLREQRLHGTMFGGLFGEGWIGFKAPRSVFYSYAVLHAILWIVSTMFFAAAFGAIFGDTIWNSVLIASIIIHTVFVWNFLRVQRGPDAFKGWFVFIFIEIFVELLFVMPLATVVFETHNALTKAREVEEEE